MAHHGRLNSYSCCVHTFGKVGQHLLILWRLMSPSWLYNIIVCMFCRTPKYPASYSECTSTFLHGNSRRCEIKLGSGLETKLASSTKKLLTILCRSSAYCPILTVPRSSRVNAHHAYSRSVELTYVYSYDAVTHFKRHDIQQ